MLRLKLFFFRAFPLISCNQYDYIEITCLYRYTIKLAMSSGSVIEGIAKDTSRNESRQECIVVDVNGSDVFLALDDIVKLEVLNESPKFSEIVFKDN